MSNRFITSPARVVIISLLSALICGTLLLACPCAQLIHISWLDCLFTATSSLSLTGLLTVPLSSFSWQGHFIIMLLMQIGALGLITLTIFFLSLFTTLGISTRSMSGEALELHIGQSPERLAMFIILITLACELLGFFICCGLFYPYYSIQQTLFFAAFHTISAFCSTGLTLVPLQHSLLSPSATFVLLATTGLLVFVGELGFVVWRDLAFYLKTLYERRRVQLSLHTRLVLTLTPALIAVLMLIVGILEYHHISSGSDFFYAAGDALFNAICLRSSGFTTLTIPTIQFATLLAIMVVSFIGSSPGSTGSGIKVTTFAVFLAAVKATLLRRGQVEAKGRTIPNDQVFKAMSIVTISIAFIVLSSFFLLISETGKEPFDCLFEVCSAFTNLGISRGITPLLSIAGKIVIIFTMLVGRIGSLTMLLALKNAAKSPELYYPEERVMMG
jgi:trk system potassium uptake protein TrkH